MNYVDHSDYKNLLNKFAASTEKQALNENYVDLRPVGSLSEDAPTKMSHVYAKYPESMEEKKELSPKQKKIAAAAPPEDKITGADFAAMKAEKGTKEEGIHQFHATGPTVQTVEGKHSLKNLSPDERKQLEEYVKSMKTMKEEIGKLLEKAKMGGMEEGGPNTNLTMTLGNE